MKSKEIKDLAVIQLNPDAEFPALGIDAETGDPYLLISKTPDGGYAVLQPEEYFFALGNQAVNVIEHLCKMRKKIGLAPDVDGERKTLAVIALLLHLGFEFSMRGLDIPRAQWNEAAKKIGHQSSRNN